MSRHKEDDAINAIGCPQCRAWPGANCYYQGAPTKWLNNRRYCHPERLQAHKAQKAAALARMTKGR